MGWRVWNGDLQWAEGWNSALTREIRRPADDWMPIPANGSSVRARALVRFHLCACILRTLEFHKTNATPRDEAHCVASPLPLTRHAPVFSSRFDSLRPDRSGLRARSCCHGDVGPDHHEAALAARARSGRKRKAL